MIEAKMVSETLGVYPQLTRLVTRDDFIEFSRRESFKSYIKVDLSEIRTKDGSRMQLDQKRVQWRTSVLAVFNVRLSYGSADKPEHSP
jgi:hypothetical protein